VPRQDSNCATASGDRWKLTARSVNARSHGFDLRFISLAVASRPSLSPPVPGRFVVKMWSRSSSWPRLLGDGGYFNKWWEARQVASTREH
jgi:hypothetical protein